MTGYGAWPPGDGNRPRTLPWALVLALVVVIAAVVAVVAIVVTRSGRSTPVGPNEQAAPSIAGTEAATGSAGPPAPGSALTAENLSGLFLDVDGVVKQLRVSTPHAIALKHMTVVPGMPPLLDVSTDRPDCGGVFAIPTAQTLENSGYTAARTQAFETDPRDFDVVQFAILFPDGAAAAKFVTSQHDRWNPCVDQHLSVTIGSETMPWTILDAVLTSKGDELASTAFRDDWKRACNQTAINRSNVVVGARVCSGGVQPSSLIAEAMAKRVPAA